MTSGIQPMEGPWGSGHATPNRSCPPSSPRSPIQVIRQPLTQITHISVLYIGGGQMVDAPDFGHVVKTESYRYKGDDFAGLRAPLVSLQL